MEEDIHLENGYQMAAVWQAQCKALYLKTFYDTMIYGEMR